MQILLEKQVMKIKAEPLIHHIKFLLLVQTMFAKLIKNIDQDQKVRTKIHL